MAYKADIQLAVKGLRELRSLNIHLDRNGKAVDRSIEKIMKYNSVTRSHFVPTLNNLSSALAKAQANFDKANISTVQGIKAAENLAKAEKLVNAELIARNALMGTVRGRAFGPQQADAGQTVAAQKQQASDQEQLNQALLKLENRSLDNISKKVELRNKEVAQGKKLVSEAGNRRKILANNNKLRTQEFRTAGKIQEREIRIGRILEKNAKFRNSFRGRTQRAIAGGSRENLDIRNQAISNALIGGAFPLLFGQGAGASAGGALGGAAGGLLGGQFGFALSLVGTQIGSIIDTFVAGTAELGRAIGPFTQDTQAVTAALGLQGSAEESRIKLIEETQGKTAAFNASMRLMATEIGQRGVDSLKRFGENTRLLTSSFTLAITKLQAFTAGIVNFVARITGLQAGLEADAATRTVAAAAGEGNVEAQALVDRRKAAESLRGQGGEGARKKILLDQISAEEKIFAIRRNTSIEADNLTQKFDALGVSIKAEAEETRRIAELRKQGLNPALAQTIAGIEKEGQLAKSNLQVEIDKLIEKQAKVGQLEEKDQIRLTTLEATRNKIDEQVDSLSEAAEATDRLNESTKDMKSNFEKIGESIASGVSDNLVAAIQGTKTLGEAAKSILNDISSTLIRLGVNTMLSQIPGFGGLLGFSKGGRPPVGKASIVGEKGPELFVPKRSGTIIPNDKLGGGSTNISVNVDASGSSVQGDAQQSKELGRAISAAIQSELLKQRRPGGLLR